MKREMINEAMSKLHEDLMMEGRSLEVVIE